MIMAEIKMKRRSSSCASGNIKWNTQLAGQEGNTERRNRKKRKKGAWLFDKVPDSELLAPLK